MTYYFTSFATVYQSYQDSGQVIMKVCLQWNPPFGLKRSLTQMGLNPMIARSVGKWLTYSAPATNSLDLVKAAYTGFIRVREMSGKFKIFLGQGIVREFHNLSGKIEFLLKCQGNVREF